MAAGRCHRVVSFAICLLLFPEVLSLNPFHIKGRYINRYKRTTSVDENQSYPDSKITLKNTIDGEISVVYGQCNPSDIMLHTEDFIIENEGPSTLSGVFEFYLDLPAKITCVEIQDKGDSTSRSTPLLSSGGPGYDWLAVKVRGKYSKGVFVLVKVLGALDKTALSKNVSNQ